MNLLLLLGAICVGYKLIAGRWPWEKKPTTRQQAVIRARQLLGLEAGAGREEILAAHKRLVAMVHPDRGGTNDQVQIGRASCRERV